MNLPVNPVGQRHIEPCGVPPFMQIAVWQNCPVYCGGQKQLLGPAGKPPFWHGFGGPLEVVGVDAVVVMAGVVVLPPPPPTHRMGSVRMNTAPFSSSPMILYQ